MKSIPLLLLLTGCAAAPISLQPIPDGDLAQCRTLSENHSLVGRALTRGSLEAARSAGVASVITEVAKNVSIWPIVAGYFVTSALGGAVEAQDRRDAIVRECLRDRGHKVY